MQGAIQEHEEEVASLMARRDDDAWSSVGGRGDVDTRIGGNEVNRRSDDD
jgi:hypothetical protein